MIARIDEVTRNELIRKSQGGSNYKTLSGNRWTARKQCSISNSVKDYNKIDMDTFWKKDLLKFDLTISGETDTYIVTVEFNDILKRIKEKVTENENKLDVKYIYKALAEALNSVNVKVNCSCPDFKYRLRAWATKDNYNAGQPENRPAVITNPNNNLGAACKHILFVLNNADWLRKIASVINNYINYCKDNLQKNYARFIFPKIYGISYDKALELVAEESDEKLPSDEATINLSNALGRVRGRIKPGSNKNPASNK